jgi:ABC-type antimicrobial peptide transport system permease subunit
MWDRFSLVVRTDGTPPEELAGVVRRTLAAVNPGIAVEDVRTLDAIVDAARGPVRLAASLMAGFGLLALVLAAVGIYGVFAYAVAERRRELAIRLALGAAPAALRRLVLGQGARLVGASFLVGGAGTLVLARATRALFYGVGPLDPASYAAGASVLAAAALLACWLPAERAARVAPTEALRQD